MKKEIKMCIGAILFSSITGLVFGYYLGGGYIVQVEKTKVIKEQITVVGLKDVIERCQKERGTLRSAGNLDKELKVYCLAPERLIFELEL